MQFLHIIEFGKCITNTCGIEFRDMTKFPKLTLRAIFLSLFIAENCFKRLKTAESRGLS